MIHIYGDKQTVRDLDDSTNIRHTSLGMGGRVITVAQLDRIMADDDTWELLKLLAVEANG